MADIDWLEAGTFTDILYHKVEGIAKITINRPRVRNAFRPQTVAEMIRGARRRPATTRQSAS